MSLMGKICTFVVSQKLNFNPEKNEEKNIDVVLATKEMGNFMKCDKLKGNYNDEIIDVDGCPLEVFSKKGSDSEKIIYFLHGGAYIGGMSGMYRKWAKFLINATGAKIFMPDYRVAPEYVFPAQLEDAEKCWNYLLSQGYKEENIVIAGDSAGGNLSLALMLKLRDEGRKLPCGAALFSPWGDMTCSGESYVRNYPNDVMFGYKGREFEESKRAELLKSAIFSFVGSADRKNPLVSPVFGEYHDFPECFLIAAKNEMLLSDTLTVAEKINQAGGKAEVFAEHNMFHVYPILVDMCSEAKIANKLAAEFINKKFANK